MSAFPLVKVKIAGNFLFISFLAFGQLIMTPSALKGRFFNSSFAIVALFLFSIAHCCLTVLSCASHKKAPYKGAKLPS